MQRGDRKLWTLGGLLLALLGGLGLYLLLTPAALSAEPLAEVVMVQGKVEYSRSGGERRPLTETTRLDARDVLFTDLDAFAILRLKNEHLVRIDEDLRLPVKSIAALRSTRPAAPDAEQLAALLYPEEKPLEARALAGAERTAGWHSRIMAGESVPADRADTARKGIVKSLRPFEMPEAIEEAAEEEAAAPAEAAPPAPRRPAPAPAPQAAAPMPPPPPEFAKREAAADALVGDVAAAEPTGGAGRADGARLALGETKDEPEVEQLRRSRAAAPRKKKAAASSGELPATNPEGLKRDPALRRCLFRKGNPAKLVLQVKVRQGKIHRYRLASGQRVPVCARKLLLGRAWKGPAPTGWIAVPLRRP